MRYIIPILLFILNLSVKALNVNDFTFSHIGSAEGIANQRVFSLRSAQDKSLWWTTKNGVDRYNGTVIDHYILGANNSFGSLAGRVVKMAHVDDGKEDIVVFDNTGKVYIYNKVQNRFDLMVDVSSKLQHDVILNEVIFDKEGLWLAMREGAFFYKTNGEEGNLTTVYRDLFTNHIERLKDGALLFCTNNGVYRRTSDNKMQQYLPYNVLSSYYDEKSHRLWLGTFNEGLIEVDADRPSVESAVKHDIPHNPIRCLLPYNENTILVGIDGCGVYQVVREPKGGGDTSAASLLFSANEGKNGVLHGNGIYDIVADSSNNIIIGSYSGGIDMARPVGSTTAVFTHERNNMQSIINDHVNCVMQIGGEKLFMGTDDGVSCYNTREMHWEHVARGMVVLSMVERPGGGLLLATYGNGVCEVSPGGGTTQVFKDILRDDHVYELCYDKRGNLWMGTLFGQLTVKLADGGVAYYDVNNVMSLKELSDGRMAVGTSHGIYLCSLASEKAAELNYTPAGMNDVNKFVVDLFEDDSKRLWIATDGGGVYVYDLKSGKSEQITTRDGLPSNSVSSVIMDKGGRMWFGTEGGLAFADPAKPHEVIDVNYCYGLDTDYSRGAVANLANGDILYGTVGAGIVVSPKNVQKINYTASLSVRYVEVHGIEYKNVEECQRGIEIINENVAEGLKSNEIRLSYSQRSFSIYFEAINMRNQFDVAYQYQIGNSEWSEPSVQQSIRFENLEPGHHVLHIRAVSKTSGVVLDEKQIDIYISQPWWNTWWMWLFYIVLLALAFYGAWRVYHLHNSYMLLVMEKAKGSLPGERYGAKNADALTSSDNHTAETSAIEEREPEERDGAQDSASEEFVNSATRIVLDNLMDTDFTIDNLCREMAMSRTLFYVKLKTYTGKSPQDFVRVIRLERASALLRKGRSVTDVSVLVGFENPKYFSTVFKKYFGVSPSKYL